MIHADLSIHLPFVQPLNFLDPLLTSNSKQYIETRLKDLIRGRYLISKYTHTSYLDAGKISPLERDYIIGFITDQIKAEQKAIQENKNKKKNNR